MDSSGKVISVYDHNYGVFQWNTGVGWVGILFYYFMGDCGGKRGQGACSPPTFFDSFYTSLL